jgi:hypothetical protein
MMPLKHLGSEHCLLWCMSLELVTFILLAQFFTGKVMYNKSAVVFEAV